MNLTYLTLNGDEARAYADKLGQLRLDVFKTFPYLYEGTLEYERKYLEIYFKSSHSLIFLVLDGVNVVGATTGILASDEEESFRKPLADYGLDPKKVFYFGESILLPEYRGQGIGKRFFVEREKFARTHPQVEWLTFCAVERASDHPLRPIDYHPLDTFQKRI